MTAGMLVLLGGALLAHLLGSHGQYAHSFPLQREGQGARNLARIEEGLRVEASSVETYAGGTSDPSHPAFAFDGTDELAWLASGADRTPWLRARFAAPRDVDSVTVRARGVHEVRARCLFAAAPPSSWQRGEVHEGLPLACPGVVGVELQWPELPPCRRLRAAHGGRRCAAAWSVQEVVVNGR